jgi:hypothetical protein
MKTSTSCGIKLILDESIVSAAVERECIEAKGVNKS